MIVQTQWIIAPMGGYAGLNYAAIESAMNMSGIKAMHRKKIFSDMRIIEIEILTVKSQQK